jgi:hypothetical protein
VSSKYPRIRESVDEVAVEAFHYGDGYYLATFRCRVCGDEATLELRMLKNMVRPKWKAWAREHYHNP